MTEYEKVVVLRVPTGLEVTPWMQTTAPGLIGRSLEYLRQTFPNAAVRHEVRVDGDIRTAEFHKLDYRDAEAGLRLLDFLLKDGMSVTRVDIITGFENAPNIVASIYVLGERPR